MNFKKYHVSRNLFPLDESKLHVGRIENDGTIDYQVGIITVGTDSVTYEANTAWRGFYTDFIQVNENEKLTISPASSDIAWSCCCYDENDNFLGKAYAKSTASIKIITLLTGTKKVRISVTSSNTTYTILKPMLNSGSQPIPYEPYSSEVWHDTPHYVHNTSTDTITTLPTVVYPNATTATVGLKGQMVQSGTPSPQNPVMPQGTGERTAQLIDYTQSESGGIDDSGNYVPTNNLQRSTAFTPIDETLQYFVSWTANTNLNVVRINYYTSDKAHISREQINKSGTALTIPQNAAYFKWTLYSKTDFIIDLSFVQSLQLMINTGSTALPYEPYGYKIPISSDNTTTPIYLGEVETTRRVKKLVLTGEENWTTYSEFSAQNCYQFYTNITNHNVNSEAISTHFVYTSNLRTLIDNDGTFMFDSIKYIRVHISSCTTLDDFKSYLATQYANGTPVTVWYVLAEPETGIVNEPLMKIGDYADSTSGITIPTITGKDTFDVETTLKPSEVSLSYTGWHDATVKEWDGSQWQ